MSSILEWSFFVSHSRRCLRLLVTSLSYYFMVGRQHKSGISSVNLSVNRTQTPASAESQDIYIFCNSSPSSSMQQGVWKAKINSGSPQSVINFCFHFPQPSLAVYSLPFQYSRGFSLFSHTEDDVNLISFIFRTCNIKSWNKQSHSLVKRQKCE